MLEDAGAQSVAGWASSISAGPPDESGQAVTFTATADTPALFSTQPAVSPAGGLTYTPAPNANGVAVVTVNALDDELIDESLLEELSELEEFDELDEMLELLDEDGLDELLLEPLLKLLDESDEELDKLDELLEPEEELDESLELLDDEELDELELLDEDGLDELLLELLDDEDDDEEELHELLLELELLLPSQQRHPMVR